MKSMKSYLKDSMLKGYKIKEMDWHDYAVTVLKSFANNDRPVTAFCLPPRMGATLMFSVAFPRYYEELTGKNTFLFTYSKELTRMTCKENNFHGGNLQSIDLLSYDELTLKDVKNGDLVVLDDPTQSYKHTKKEFEKLMNIIVGSINMLNGNGVKVLISKHRDINNDFIGDIQKAMCVDVVNFPDNGMFLDKKQISPLMYKCQYLQQPSSETLA